MRRYDPPNNVVGLLYGVVGAAARTEFYGPILNGHRRIVRFSDFQAVPVTPLAAFRAQRLGAVTAEPAALQWIVGPYRGHDRRSVAVAEGPTETGARYDLFRDALREVDPGSRLRTCAVVTAPAGRYFAAEVSTILGYVGVQAHVFMDRDRERTHEVLAQLRPAILVILCGDVDESRLPAEVELCVTFRASQRIGTRAQLDMYHVDELGFLGHSTDLARWILYNDQYLYEVSDGGRLVATALHNRVQPLLRLETEDPVAELGEHDMRLGPMSKTG